MDEDEKKKVKNEVVEVRKEYIQGGRIGVVLDVEMFVCYQ